VEEYIEHLRSITDWQGKKVDINHIHSIDIILRRSKLKKLWMIELSVPNLFDANRRKIAEVLVTAELEPDPAHRFDNFILARLPGWFAFLKEVDGSGPHFRFSSSVVRNHVELYLCEEARKTA